MTDIITAQKIARMEKLLRALEYSGESELRVDFDGTISYENVCLVCGCIEGCTHDADCEMGEFCR